MNFSTALDCLKDGHPVIREGWYGRWLLIQRPDEHSKITHPYIYIEHDVGDENYPLGCKVPWSPSQADIFADDWIILD